MLSGLASIWLFQAASPSVQPCDWHRILLGDLPWWYIAEVMLSNETFTPIKNNYISSSPSIPA